MTEHDAATGVLLINLGTPDSPSTGDVRRYLAEFLSDPRVLDIPSPLRWLLLHLVILRTRPPRSAEAYSQIWTDAGSPLAVHGRELQAAVAAELGDGFRVELAMRYGQPSIAAALERLRAVGSERLVALPLFPQYSAAATGSARARLLEVLVDGWDVSAATVLPDFHAAAAFIDAQAELARPLLDDFAPDHVLFSYHGLPERQIRRSDAADGRCLAASSCCEEAGAAARGCYRAQSFATTRALCAALELDAARTSTAFQSRLGRDPWIRPYTDTRLPELAAAGVRRLAILTPSFVADCLETLEELGIRAREQWTDLGGEALLVVPCVNAHPTFVRGLAAWIRRAAAASDGEVAPAPSSVG